MPNYDSDSSEDPDNYTTTDVILGYASIESGGDEISHIGGYPIWLDDKIKPPAEFSKCKNCNGYLSLLLQLNADLQQHFPNDTRRIYVLTCKSKACSRKPGSIRAFREVRKSVHTKKSSGEMLSTGNTTTDTSTPTRTSERGPGLGTMLFGATGPDLMDSPNVNPFSSSGTTLSGSGTNHNPFKSNKDVKSGGLILDTSDDFQAQTFAEKLKINADPAKAVAKATASPVTETWPEQSVFPPPYQQFYLDAYPEELDPDPPTSSAPAEGMASKVSYETEDSSGAGENDAFESTLDKTFQKFSDIIAQNPEQVLRYEFTGQPLLYSSTDGVSSRFVVPHGKVGAVKGMPRCESCGARRVFELQVMPYLIFEVEKDETLDIEDGMEWGTIIVGACANNCGSSDGIVFREEWIGAQWEERVSRK